MESFQQHSDNQSSCLTETCSLSPRQFSAITDAISTAVSQVFTARCVCIAQTMPWQDVCPSVHLSVTCRYSVETAKHIIKVFSPSASQTIVVFFRTKLLCNIPTGTPLTRATNARRMNKSRFSTNISLFLQNGTR